MRSFGGAARWWLEFDVTDYDDADTHRAQLVGWDREITLLEPGPLELRWMQVILDDVVVAEGSLARAITDWSTVAEGRLNFVVCLSTPRPARWCGIEAGPGEAIVGGAGRDYRSITPAGFRSLEFIVPEALFPELCVLQGGPNAPDFSPRSCFSRLDPTIEAKVTRLRLALFADPATTALTMTDPTWAGALRERILGLLQGLADRFAEPVRAPPAARAIPGYAMTVRAMLYIDANAPYLDRVVEVAEALGVSTRALQQAFRSYARINPHQYLLARKLHLARRQLGRPSLIRSPVTDAAVSSDSPISAASARTTAPSLARRHEQRWPAPKPHCCRGHLLAVVNRALRPRDAADARAGWPIV